jgi:glycolate oxidase FAD binding subunit
VPEAVALLNPELSRELGWENWTLLLRFEGFREETSEGADEARKHAGTRGAESIRSSVWDEIRDFPARPLGEAELLLRGLAAPARAFALAESWQDGGPLVAYPDSGLVYSHTRDLEALANRRETATLCGANTVVERAPSSIKNEADVFGEIPESFEIMKRIKEKLDPRGILSPGRFVGRL